MNRSMRRFITAAACATLIGGEAFIATGLYLRFLRHPSPSRVGLSLTPRRCALSLRF